MPPIHLSIARHRPFAGRWPLTDCWGRTLELGATVDIIDASTAHWGSKAVVTGLYPDINWVSVKQLRGGTILVFPPLKLKVYAYSDPDLTLDEGL